MIGEGHHPNYVLIWKWLMSLVILSILASLFLPKLAAIAVIYVIAITKAILVVMNYMHLKYEKPLIYALVFVPLLFIIILTLLLFPDFVFHG
jgi:caa(3)-type oxidase subunit IV